MTTSSLPALSARLATSTAAHTAAPEEIPTRMPSSLAIRRAIVMASSFFTRTISS